MGGRILVVAKAPVRGRVKTRLAATLGEQAALELATAFLADTVALVDRIPGARGVLATTASLAGPPGWEVWQQGEGDLGARLERLARRGLAGARWVVLLGADSPGMPARLLEAACAAASDGRAALIPAADGGFVALALPRYPDGLLDGIPWSTATAAASTLDALHRADLDVLVVDGWFDVDEAADLDRLRATVDPADAPATFRVLDARTDRGGNPKGRADDGSG